MMPGFGGKPLSLKILYRMLILRLAPESKAFVPIFRRVSTEVH